MLFRSGQSARQAELIATYLERGILWAGGSDYDVTPLPARYGLWSSVVRMPLQGTYGTHPFGQRESVTVKTALKSYTKWAARQLFLEAETGTLEAGKSADIAIWQQNPLTIPADQIKSLHCSMTLYRGKVIWSDGALRSTAWNAHGRSRQ